MGQPVKPENSAEEEQKPIGQNYQFLESETLLINLSA